MSELHAATGSYALNALDAAELAEFEAHLATCGICQSEVADFCETAAELSLLSLATPPPTLRNSIMDAIRNTPQLAPEGQDEETAVRPVVPRAPVEERRTELNRHTRPGLPRRAVPGSEASEEPERPSVDELALRRQRRRIRILSGLVAAILAVAVGLGGVVYTLVQQRQAQIAQITLEEQLYAAPDARIVTADLEGGGQVSFIASKQLNRAMFIGTDLPNPGPNNRYQLWTGNGALPTITGVSRDTQIADTGPGVKVFFSGNVAGADFLAVNLEPVGSTPDEPTTQVLAAGAL